MKLDKILSYSFQRAWPWKTLCRPIFIPYNQESYSHLRKNPQLSPIHIFYTIVFCIANSGHYRMILFCTNTCNLSNLKRRIKSPFKREVFPASVSFFSHPSDVIGDTDRTDAIDTFSLTFS